MQPVSDARAVRLPCVDGRLTPCAASTASCSSTARPRRPDALRAMGRLTVHRGPDDEGVHVDGPLALGMRRLSIIDVAGGHQPLSNEDGTLWLVANGEIYNYRELREALIAQGHRVPDRAPTAKRSCTCTSSYGDACVEHLNGMFAFALWDARRPPPAPRPRPAGREAAVRLQRRPAPAVRERSEGDPRGARRDRRARSGRAVRLPRARLRAGAAVDLPRNPQAAARRRCSWPRAAASSSAATGGFRRPSTRRVPRTTGSRRPRARARGVDAHADGERRADRRVPVGRRRLERGRRVHGAAQRPPGEDLRDRLRRRRRRGVLQRAAVRAPVAELLRHRPPRDRRPAGRRRAAAQAAVAHGRADRGHRVHHDLSRLASSRVATSR